ncbi:hypothetical protein D3C81_1869480 [compost metagenome]
MNFIVAINYRLARRKHIAACTHEINSGRVIPQGQLPVDLGGKNDLFYFSLKKLSGTLQSKGLPSLLYW